MEDNNAEMTARAAMKDIEEMVAALECDYDALEELKATTHPKVLHGKCDVCGRVGDGCTGSDELTELMRLSGGCENRDVAGQGIQENPLSIEVRSGWRGIGDKPDGPVEFKILLVWGGPAVQIVGELNNYEPSSPRIEYQDWGTPWTELRGDINREALLTYCQQFYFGG